jgi:hypothetical protein
MRESRMVLDVAAAAQRANARVCFVKRGGGQGVNSEYEAVDWRESKAESRRYECCRQL